MNKPQYLAAFRANRDAFIETVRRGLEPQVPACPAYNVGALAAHIAGVYLFWNKRLHSPVGSNAEIETEDAAEFPGLLQFWQTDSREAVPPNILDYLIIAGDRLEASLAAAEPAQPVDTWFPPDQTAGFVQRRMAQETAVHRWDAQHAHGITESIAAELARDGIDEMLDVMLPMRREWIQPRPSSGETYHLHRTDSEGEWLVRFQPDKVEITREHGKGGVALRGTASDLLLFLWGRVPADSLEVLGNRELVDRWFALVPPD